MRVTLGAVTASPFDRRDMRATRTAYSPNSAGRYPNPCGGNAYARRGSFQRPDAQSMIESQCGGTGCRKLCGTLGTGSRRASRETANAGWRRREIPLSLSSCPTCLLSKRHGSVCRGGTETRLTPPPPSRQGNHRADEGGVSVTLPPHPSANQSHTSGGHPFPVDNSIPREEEIVETFKRLRLNRSGGPSGMRAEHLRQLK